MANTVPFPVVTLLAASSAALAAVAQRHLCRQKALKAPGEATKEVASWWDEACGVLTAWVLENSTLLTMASLMTGYGLFPPVSREHPLRTLLGHVSLSVIAGEATWFIQWAYAEFVYAEVPYFAPAHRKPQPTLKDFVQEWAQLYIPTRIVLGATGVGQIHGGSQEAFEEILQGLRNEPQGPFGFLLLFIISRALFDLSHWGIHRFLHLPGVHWVHAKHHEHAEPSMLSNSHFTLTDLLMESALPMTFATAGLLGMEGAGFPLSALQRTYCLYSLAWTLSISHVGKPIPAATVCPPLSFLPVVDRELGGGVAHHQAHHRYPGCNYSLAAWPDKLFGTFRPLRQNVIQEREAAP